MGRNETRTYIQFIRYKISTSTLVIFVIEIFALLNWGNDWDTSRFIDIFPKLKANHGFLM